MTKMIVAALLFAFVSFAYWRAGHTMIAYLSGGPDTSVHVTYYNESCDGVRKQYVADTQHRRMTYPEYKAMLIALGACDAHATPAPGDVVFHGYVWAPMPQG